MKKIVAIMLSATLILSSCGGASAVSTSSTAQGESPTAVHNVVPYSLESIGYTFQYPADTGVFDPNKENDALDIHPHEPPHYFISNMVTQPIAGADAPGQYMFAVYGSENLRGNYLMIQPNCIYRANSGDSEICFSLLQTFLRKDLEQENAVIRFLRPLQKDGLNKDYFDSWANASLEEYFLPVSELDKYLVYSDDKISVYDFFEFSSAPPLESQLERLSQEMHYADYGIDVNWLLSVRDYILNEPGGVGRFIKKGSSAPQPATKSETTEETNKVEIEQIEKVNYAQGE